MCPGAICDLDCMLAMGIAVSLRDAKSLLYAAVSFLKLCYRYKSRGTSDPLIEMHGQWLIVLLAGLFPYFPSARGFGSVRQGCCFEFVEHVVEESTSSMTTWTRSFCYGQHVGGWDPHSISKADCLEEAGVFRDCSQVCAPPLIHPRPRDCATPHQHSQPHQPHE